MAGPCGPCNSHEKTRQDIADLDKAHALTKQEVDRMGEKIDILTEKVDALAAMLSRWAQNLAIGASVGGVLVGVSVWVFENWEKFKGLL